MCRPGSLARSWLEHVSAGGIVQAGGERRCSSLLRPETPSAWGVLGWSSWKARLDGGILVEAPRLTPKAEERCPHSPHV